ncbi:hypothetical protein WA026_013069 [Henosepilachna vigintioctopunctata]|uniref:Uncharacterized protein n=1 Tax=Henosepilachna vigintioctopunctata TaxID=420089 RepID=A0AAW1UJN4_9CUCU
MSGGINGTIETFNLVNNKINTLQAGSISILSKTVNILDNTLEYLKSGCLEKISPGLLVDSHTSFGNLEFIYKFNNNNIINVDAGSLNPDIEAYTKVSTDFIFSYNSFLCTCENIGWLMSKVGHGYNSIALRDFYDIISEDNGSNICSGLSCRKSISSIKHLLENGQCNSDLSMENFCRLTTTAKSQSASEKSDSDEVVGITWINRTDLIRSGENKLFYNLTLLLLTVFVNITRIL